MLKLPDPVAVHPTASLRLLQLNCLCHWAVDNETAEGFAHRNQLHLEYIQQWQPDICVLEEVDGPTTCPDNVPSLGHLLLQTKGEVSYEAVHDAKGSAKADETWILYRSDQWALQSNESFRFDEGKGSQFALIAEFKTRSTDEDEKRFLLIAMHAKAGRSAEMEAVRVAHAQQLWAHLTSSPSYAPYVQKGHYIWAGDMNAGPHTYQGKYPCLWYPFLFGKKAEPEAALDAGQEVPSEGFAATVGLKSAYVSLTGSEPLFTTIKHRDGALISQCIDYVFVGNGVEVAYVAPMPTVDDVPPRALPCDNWASDHLTLIVDVKLL